MTYFKLLFFVGLHFPFLTILTLFAFIVGLKRSKKTDALLFITGCVWIILSAETIGFVIFFDDGDLHRIILGLIPLILSSIMLLTIKVEYKWVNSTIKKLLSISIFLVVGIGSYISKTTTEEINCWYYFNDNTTCTILFAETPNRTFEVLLSSNQFENQVKAEALQYEERTGYYCPETRVRVTTRFSKFVSAEIISFRNSEINKKVKFNEPIKIPLHNATGKLEILKPNSIRIWN